MCSIQWVKEVLRLDTSKGQEYRAVWPLRCWVQVTSVCMGWGSVGCGSEKDLVAWGRKAPYTAEGSPGIWRARGSARENKRHTVFCSTSVWKEGRALQRHPLEDRCYISTKSSVFRSSLNTLLPWDRVSHWARSSSFQLGQLTSEFSGSAYCFHVCSHAQLFTWVLGIKTQVLFCSKHWTISPAL